VLLTNQDVKDIRLLLDELTKKVDNLHSLFEKIRNNEVRTLMYAQLNARQLNFLLWYDQIKSGHTNIPIYEQIIQNDEYKEAHHITKKSAKDLSELVWKKSKGRKDLLEDEFTKSLAFYGGIDETLL